MKLAIRSFALAICLLAVAGTARAELAAWDQAKVTELAQQLEAETARLFRTFRDRQQPTLGSSQRLPYHRLKQEVRFLRRESRSLSQALQRGAGFDETLPSYETMMQTVRRAQNNARTVFTTADMQESADAARAILNQLGPFYDPNFTAVDPPERR